MSRKLRFLAKYVDANGVGHVAVHSYDRLTGFVDMMKDFKFDDVKYPMSEVHMRTK